MTFLTIDVSGSKTKLQRDDNLQDTDENSCSLNKITKKTVNNKTKPTPPPSPGKGRKASPATVIPAAPVESPTAVYGCNSHNKKNRNNNNGEESDISSYGDDDEYNNGRIRKKKRSLKTVKIGKPTAVAAPSAAIKLSTKTITITSDDVQQVPVGEPLKSSDNSATTENGKNGNS